MPMGHHELAVFREPLYSSLLRGHIYTAKVKIPYIFPLREQAHKMQKRVVEMLASHAR